MWKDVASLTVCCVLFVQMGLADAILEELRLKAGLLSCPKCLTFWSTLLWQIFHGQPALAALTASFLFSYAALWLALIYDYLAIIYNKAYESISQTDATADNLQAGAPGDNRATPDADGLPEVRKGKKINRKQETL